jgi:beta-glucanase (GH16 family)
MIAIAQIAHAQQSNMPPADDYKLVWSDEFDTDGPPDPKNWTYERGFVRNQEAQWYQPDNARCENGMLIIEARKEKFKNPNYDPAGFRWQSSREFADHTSASLTTRRLHEFTYGRFEMKAKIDTRDGIWPAFWTLGSSRRWPAGGEIDIMEYYRGMLKANVAWAGQNRRNGATWRSTVKQLDEFPTDWPTKFHVWRMDWDENAIKLFVDDQLLNETSLKDTVNNDPQQTNPFHSPQYIILNVAIGGTEGGDPSKTDFPSRMEVDYVRVSQKSRPGSPQNGTVNP